MKFRLYIDLYGVIGYLPPMTAYEDVLNHNLADSMKPSNSILGAINKLKSRKEVEMHIIHKSLSEDSLKEYDSIRNWMNKNKVDLDLVLVNDYINIPEGIGNFDFLLDDNYDNLTEWKKHNGNIIYYQNMLNPYRKDVSKVEEFTDSEVLSYKLLSIMHHDILGGEIDG